MSDPLSNDLASLRIQKSAEAAPRSGGKVWVGVVFGFAAVGGGVMFAIPHLEAALFKTEVEATEVLSVSPATVSTDVTASGYVIAQLISKVGSRLQGRIEKVHVVEGQTVKRGDLLLTLEDADQRSAIATGQARVAASKAEAQRQRVQLEDARRKAKREKTLSEEGVTGRAAAEDLEAESRTLAESVNAAEAEILAAQSNLQALSIGLEHLTIRAPIDGTILTKPPGLGEVVSPVGPPLLEVADFASLLVEADVPEGRLSKVKLDGPCEIMLDAYPARRYRGVVKEISPTVNRSKATVIVKVGFVGEASGVLPNMAARAFFLQDAKSAEQIGQPPKTVVPGAAVLDLNGMKLVFVIEGDRVKMTQVKLGPELGNGYELNEGPRVGTRLVKKPPSSLKDGQRIKERNPK